MDGGGFEVAGRGVRRIMWKCESKNCRWHTGRKRLGGGERAGNYQGLEDPLKK